MLLRTNSSQITFERNIRKFQNRLLERGSPVAILRMYLSEVEFADRKTALQQRDTNSHSKNLYVLLHKTILLYLQENTYGEMPPSTKLATTKGNL